MKSEIMSYHENFLWISLHGGLILKIFNELQDFNDLHKKIKAKILEDMRFYTRFLEISLEILGKSSIEKETFELCNEFLSSLGQLTEKIPSIFKHSQRQMLVVLIKLLSKSDFHPLHSVQIPLFSLKKQIYIQNLGCHQEHSLPSHPNRNGNR